MNGLENIINDIYGEVEVVKGNSDELKELKKKESEMFSQYTMNYSKKFSTWW